MIALPQAIRATAAFVLVLLATWAMVWNTPLGDYTPPAPLKAAARTWPDAELEARVVAFLSSQHEQPQGGILREGAVYFFPEEPRLRRMSRTPLSSGSQLTVYRAALWFVHWGPEWFPTIAWAYTDADGVKVGSTEDPTELAEALTRVLAGSSFDRIEQQEWLAQVIGEPVAHLLWPREGTEITVLTRNSCSEAFARLRNGRSGHFLGAACFSPDGRLVEIRVRGVR